jgi:RND family efflux transporter MFP subunit
VKLIALRCLVLAGGLLTGSAQTDTNASVPSVQIETVSLHEELLSETVDGFGSIVTSDEAMVDISFPRAGQIAELRVRVGERVRAGQTLIKIDADPSTLSSYERAVAALEFAKRELERSKSLFAQHLATNAQVAAAQKAFEDATVAIEIERKLGNDQRSWVVTAPFDGYVAQLMVAAGDRIQANTGVLKLARTDRGARATFGLRIDDARRVLPGMKAEVTAVLMNTPSPVAGIVRGISGTVNPATKLIDAWIDLASSEVALVPGTAVVTRIVLSQHQGWVVPRDAVLHDNNGDYIFQVASGVARRVNVRTGISNDLVTEVSGEFDTGLKVITVGNYELEDGMAVRQAPPSVGK